MRESTKSNRYYAEWERTFSISQNSEDKDIWCPILNITIWNTCFCPPWDKKNFCSTRWWVKHRAKPTTCSPCAALCHWNSHFDTSWRSSQTWINGIVCFFRAALEQNSSSFKLLEAEMMNNTPREDHNAISCCSTVLLNVHYPNAMEFVISLS